MDPVISTTTPAPPTGVTPTEVPLGISGTVSETAMPVNLPPDQDSVFAQQGRGIYIGKFTVDTSQTTGTEVFSWTIRAPTTVGGVNAYEPVISPDEIIQFRAAWELLLPMYSTQCKMDFDLEFIPVKVGDSRVSFDIVFNQENRTLTYNEVVLANDSVHKIIDDTDDPIKISVPVIWPTNNIQTRSTYRNGSLIQPAFLPYTKLQVFIRNPFQPNMMQPISFEIIVILHPKPHSVIGMAGMGPVFGNTASFADLSFPIPWFITK